MGHCVLTARVLILQDMAPYVGLLMPELQAAVVDPLPEVRATAARALGSLLRGMGADHFTELVPWLLATLRSEVRRSAVHPFKRACALPFRLHM